MQIEPELRSDEIVRFDKAQLDKFAHSVSAGFLMVRFLRFYADLLQQYRRSHTLVILNLLSYSWLFIQSVFILTLINYSIYIAAPQQFNLDGKASFIRFLFYSTTSLYGNTIPQVTASGELSLFVATVSVIYGPIFLVSLAGQIFVSLRQSRDDAAFGDLIGLVKSREITLSRLLEEEYEVTPDEAYQRLRALGLGAELFMAYLASKIPDDIDGSGEPYESSGETSM